MSVPRTATDVHGNRYAAVPVAELDDWAWLLTRLEDWLGHAGHDTVEDWADFAGPGGISLDQVLYVLSHWAPACAPWPQHPRPRGGDDDGQDPRTAAAR